MTSPAGACHVGLDARRIHHAGSVTTDRSCHSLSGFEFSFLLSSNFGFARSSASVFLSIVSELRVTGSIEFQPSHLTSTSPFSRRLVTVTTFHFRPHSAESRVPISSGVSLVTRSESSEIGIVMRYSLAARSMRGGVLGLGAFGAAVRWNGLLA